MVPYGAFLGSYLKAKWRQIVVTTLVLAAIFCALATGLNFAVYWKANDQLRARNVLFLKLAGKMPSGEASYLEMNVDSGRKQVDPLTDLTAHLISSLASAGTDRAALQRLSYFPDRVEWLQEKVRLNLFTARFKVYRTVEGVEVKPPWEMVRLSPQAIGLWSTARTSDVQRMLVALPTWKLQQIELLTWYCWSLLVTLLCVLPNVCFKAGKAYREQITPVAA